MTYPSHFTKSLSHRVYGMTDNDVFWTETTHLSHLRELPHHVVYVVQQTGCFLKEAQMAKGGEVVLMMRVVVW